MPFWSSRKKTPSRVSPEVAEWVVGTFIRHEKLYLDSSVCILSVNNAKSKASVRHNQCDSKDGVKPEIASGLSAPHHQKIKRLEDEQVCAELRKSWNDFIMALGVNVEESCWGLKYLKLYFNLNEDAIFYSTSPRMFYSILCGELLDHLTQILYLNIHSLHNGSLKILSAVIACLKAIPEYIPVSNLGRSPDRCYPELFEKIFHTIPQVISMHFDNLRKLENDIEDKQFKIRVMMLPDFVVASIKSARIIKNCAKGEDTLVHAHLDYLWICYLKALQQYAKFPRDREAPISIRVKTPRPAL